MNRVVFSLPPRHSKSMTVSETFPSWFIGKNPERRVIEVSYSDSLARRFGRSNKSKIVEYGQDLFGISVPRDNTSATSWGIAGHRGGMISAGVGGSITGEGADLLLIDDPVKNRQQAESVTYREMIWNEWESTLLTRLQSGGAVIIILTRWHEDDLVGRLLEKERENWHVVSLPALAVEDDLLGRSVGEALWSEGGYDKKWAEKTKVAVGSRTWSALYQQRPAPSEGGMFKRHWFEIVPEAPSDMKTIRFWDLASTEEKKGSSDPDYTVGAKMGEKDGVYYVCDIARDRLSAKGVQDLVKHSAQMDGHDTDIWMEQEGGASGKNTIDTYARHVLRGYTFRGVRATGSKTVRAEPMSAAAEAGNVKIVKGSWNREFIEEIASFPNAPHDDQVDAVAGAFNKLQEMNRVQRIRVSRSSRVS